MRYELTFIMNESGELQAQIRRPLASRTWRCCDRVCFFFMPSNSRATGRVCCDTMGGVTASGRALLSSGKLRAKRIYAHPVVRNPASGPAREQTEVSRQGSQRKCVQKWGA